MSTANVNIADIDIRNFFDSLPVAVFFYDNGCIIRGTNSRADALYGTNNLADKKRTLGDLLEINPILVEDARMSGREVTLETKLKNSGGESVDVTVTPRTLADDVNALYVQVDQGAPHRKVASALAHEYRNVGTAVGGYIGLAKLCALKLTDVDQAELIKLIGNLESALAAVEIMADLSAVVLRQSRTTHSITEPLNLGQVYREASRFLSLSLGTKNVTINYSSAAGDDADNPDYVVNASKTGIVVIMMNLLRNGAEAMRNTGDIYASIGIENKGDGDKPAANYIVFTVRDTGCGMDENAIARIFDAFYTTKPKGTGLGLSTVLGLVKEFNGFIEVESELSKGSTFKVYLPQSTVMPKNIETPPASGLNGTEKILYIEYHPEARAVTAEVLGNHGYDVTVCTSNRELDDYLARDGNGTCLFIVGGRRHHPSVAPIVEQIRGRQIPIIYMSTSDRRAYDKIIENGDGFVHKPYDITELLTVVRRTIGTKTSS